MTHRRFRGRDSAHNIRPNLARSQSIVRMRNNRSSKRRGGSSHTTRRRRRKCRSRPSQAAPGRQRQWFAWFSPWQTEQRCPPLYSNRTWADFAERDREPQGRRLPRPIARQRFVSTRRTYRENPVDAVQRAMGGPHTADAWAGGPSADSGWGSQVCGSTHGGLLR